MRKIIPMTERKKHAYTMRYCLEQARWKGLVCWERWVFNIKTGFHIIVSLEESLKMGNMYPPL